MNFNDLSKIIFNGLKPKLQKSKALAIFARERSKFEGWLKVELCEILSSKGFKDVVPEKNRIDVTFENWAIELKTANTSYKYNDVRPKTRPITKNVDGVVKDIRKLKKSRSRIFINKSVLFIVFPLERNNPFWNKCHLPRICDALKKRNLRAKDFKAEDFKFQNGVPGVIYFGLVR